MRVLFEHTKRRRLQSEQRDPIVDNPSQSLSSPTPKSPCKVTVDRRWRFVSSLTTQCFLREPASNLAESAFALPGVVVTVVRIRGDG
jgi:hypothetical protein